MKKILPLLQGSREKIILLFVVLFFHSFAFSQTRFYLNLGTPAAISPAYNAGWNVTSGAARYEMSPTRDGSTIASKTTGNSGAIAVRKCLLDQWVSEPLAAQTITGTFTGQVRFQQSTTTAVTGQGFVYVRVINTNGTIATEVGSTTTTNLTTTLTNRTLISFNVGTLNITAGQRIAIDLGWNYSVGVTTTPNCTISRGSSSGTDLPVNNSTTTANTPWVEFSDNITFLPPANDECTGAISLTPGATCTNIAGTLEYATPNAGTPLGCFAAGTYYDVWYSFVATTYTHTVNLSGLGANFTAPRIQVYQGSCGALVSMNCTSGTTHTQANLIPGNTYYVRVANYNTDPSGTGTVANFNICVTNNPPPANDACANSTLLTSNYNCTNTTGNLQYASTGTPAGSCGGATALTTYGVWYRFVANSTTQYVTLSGLGSNLAAATTYIETFSSSGTCAGLTSIDCQSATSPEMLTGLTIGATYYVRVYVTTAPNNATTANWNFSICVQRPPANDDCSGAVTLTPGGSCSNTAGVMTMATADGTTPLGCFAAGTYQDVWYRFTAASTIQLITLSSLGANFSAPRIQIYSGTCGSLTSIGCGTGTSWAQWGLTIGTTYYVRIANYNVNALTAAAFNICITNITPVANDECTGAITLTTASACNNTTGTFINASPNTTGLPACGDANSAEVWYRFIANSNRPTITLSSLGSNLNTAGVYMQLFSGLCGSLTPLACVSGNTLNTAVTPGGVGLTINSTYYIRITTNTATGVPTSGNWGFNICVTDPAGAAVDFAKTYVNITDGTAGGTIDPGDVLEIRSILVVQRPGGTGPNVAIDNVAFFDTLTANKGYRLLRDSMALKTNEGKLFRPTNNSYFTDSGADSDAAWITTSGAGSDTTLQINMGTGASRTVRGKIGHTSRPSNFGSTCIIMATYRVRVTANYGTKIMYGGGAFQYRDSTTGVTYTVNFPKDSLIVYSSPGACPDAISATNVIGDEFNGTFGLPTGSPVYPQNRSTSANTGYAYATFGGGNGPGDYYYGITNNTSGNGTVNQSVIKPTTTTRVFNVWDISGDHTGSTNINSNLSRGNPPCNLNLPISATNPCGYMLVVNSAYRADVAFEYNFSGACTETYYEISAWMKNVCSKCGGDSLGNSSTTTGYSPTGVGDSSGVRPNVAFQINGIDYYTTGDIVHQGVGAGINSSISDTMNRWVRRSFVYKTQPGQTNFTMTFRNNAPGGGGNDWAIDDISIRTCYPNMTYSPSLSPYACANSTLLLSDTVRSYYNTYIKYKWQRSTDGGVTWTDIAGTTGTATPTVVNGMYEFVTTYTVPAAFTTPANNGDRYRVVVATNDGNLASNDCNFSDAMPITISIATPSTAPSSITGGNICSGSSTTLTAVGGALGTGANYQWGTGSTPGVNPIAGATGATYTVSPTSTTTYWVRIENTTSPCPAFTSGLTITVNVSQPSVAPSSITGINICSGSSTTLTAIGGTLGSGANYQWGTGGTVGTNPIAGATASTLVVSPTTTTTYWVRIENTTGPCTPTTSGATRTITVSQPSVAPASISAAAYSFCNTGTVTLTATGGSLGAGANYQWGTGSTVGVNPIAGATGASYNVVGLTTTTTYWVRIENTAAPCASTTGGTTTTITINNPSSAPTSITGSGFCNPGSATLTAVGGTLGTGANYQWGTGTVYGTNPIAGATSSTLVVSPTVTTTYWVRIENTAGPCAATTGGTQRVITVTQPSVAPTSITAPSYSLCTSGSVTLTAAGGTLGTGANYQWGTGSTVGVNPIAGATGATYNATGISSTSTFWVRIENTSAPCVSTTGGTTVTITVNTPSVAPTSVTGTDFCNPGSTTLTAIGGSLGTGANYQWGTGTVGSNPIAGATSSTLVVSPTVTTTYWVRMENTAGPCAANTAGATRVINVSQPSVAATSATRNKNNICPGISVTLGITGGTLGTGASWRWYTGSCASTLVGTGATINVTPSVTTTYYVRAEGSCNTTTCQAVTVFISCDIDKDKDGIPDFVESAMSAAFADANGNSVINAYDVTYAGFVDNNNDFINDNFQADGDSDNDGIPNYLDTSFPGRVDSNGDGVDDRFDADLDGIINMLDLDSDNDGIPDTVEAYGADANGDARIDNFVDTDGDGLAQNVDINNTGAYNTGLGLGNIDLDGDGIPNFIDVDSDNDGIPDLVETGVADADNNGRIDGAFVDVNGDGLHDSYINGGAILLTGSDGNGDGRADSYPNKNFDADFRPNAYDMDSDGDGIVDVIEAGLPDANGNGIVDGTIAANGWSTTVSGMGGPLAISESDGDGKPDYLDIDSDNDGIPDNIEAQPTATYKLPTTADTDGDGLANIYDNVPGAFGGTGIMLYDHDGDGTPDYLDLDTDADGQPDIVEGNDFNLNGSAIDDVTTLTGLDDDQDGLDNRFDSLTSFTNRKGTSYMMGTNGSTTGDATPGTRSPCQKKTPGQIDRDWRYAGTVLPVQILSFTGVLQGTNVALKWSIIAAKDVDRFEIERSTDNTSFIKVGTVTDAVPLNVQKNFNSNDYVGNVNSDILYYRLKVIGKDGDFKYSNILIIRRTPVKVPMVLMPNPAKDYVSLRFHADKDGEVMIRIIDNAGKVVHVQRSAIGRGTNTVLMNGLNKLSSGVYVVQVYSGNDVTSEKLVISR